MQLNLLSLLTAAASTATVISAAHGQTRPLMIRNHGINSMNHRGLSASWSNLPSLSLSSSSSTSVQCVDAPVDLTLASATVDWSNLGGQGPNVTAPETVMYRNVGQYKGKVIDLEVRVKDGYYFKRPKRFNTNNYLHNGMICDVVNDKAVMCGHDAVGAYFGQVELATGHSTRLIFEFQDSATGEPMVLPGFKVSFFDIDGGGQGDNEEYIVTGWQTAMYDHDTDECYFSETESGFCDDAIEAGENCLYSKATRTGSACDQPHDPMTLGVVQCEGRTVDQKARSMQLDFAYTSSVEVFWLTGTKELNWGRGLIFAFASAWERDCTERLQPQARSTDLDNLFDGECEF